MIGQSREISGTSLDEISAKLGDRLSRHGVQSESAAILAAAIASEFAVVEPHVSRPGTLGLLIGRYAIRTDDLALLDAMIAGFAALANGQFFLNGPVAIAVRVAIAVAALKFLKPLWLRGVVLSADEARVFLIVQSNTTALTDEGLTAAEIVEILQRVSPECDMHWADEILQRLAAMTARDQSTTSLISCDSRKRWRSHA